MKEMFNLWGDALLAIFKVALPIVGILLIGAIINLIYRYSKYGYQVFHVFKKRKSINANQETIFMMLDRLPGYRKIITIKELKSQILLIDQSGLYLLNIFPYENITTGKETDKLFNVKTIGPVQNPFLELKEDIIFLKEKLKDIPIKKCVIINGLCIFQVEYSKETELLYMNRFYYTFEKHIKNIKYTKEEINEIYKKVSR